jgi:hypothetical protein
MGVNIPASSAAKPRPADCIFRFVEKNWSLRNLLPAIALMQVSPLH